MSNVEQFKKNGYVKIKLIEDELLAYLKIALDAHRELQYRANGLKWFSNKEEDLFAFGDGQIPRSFSAYAVPMFETLLLTLQSKFEEATGRKLSPCYTYSRIYYHGADMEAHKDRPSCEFSSTINIFGGERWPI